MSTIPSPAWYTMERTHNGIRTFWLSGGHYRQMLFQQYSAREVRGLMARLRREGKS